MYRTLSVGFGRVGRCGGRRRRRRGSAPPAAPGPGPVPGRWSGGGSPFPGTRLGPPMQGSEPGSNFFSSRERVRSVDKLGWAGRRGARPVALCGVWMPGRARCQSGMRDRTASKLASRPRLRSPSPAPAAAVDRHLIRSPGCVGANRVPKSDCASGDTRLRSRRTYHRVPTVDLRLQPRLVARTMHGNPPIDSSCWRR